MTANKTLVTNAKWTLMMPVKKPEVPQVNQVCQVPHVEDKEVPWGQQFGNPAMQG